MKKYYDVGNGTLSRAIIEKALKRLAQLLNEQNKRVELVAAGGVISVMLFGSRKNGILRRVEVVAAKVTAKYELVKSNHQPIICAISTSACNTPYKSLHICYSFW